MSTNSGRMEWLDVSKGLAILWIVYFHLANERGPADPAHAGTLEVFWHWLVGIGFHGVGMFLIISGWSLTQSCAKQEQRGPIDWAQWYRKKLFRLFPMYWVAHLAFVAFFVIGHAIGVPIVEGFEPLDRRFWYSFFGLRIIDIQSNFFYLNAAWWYFSALIQLYLVFPLLYVAMRRLGVWPVVIVSLVIGFGLRYVALVIAPYHESLMWFSDGLWVQGGLGLCRLPEFALGMLVAEWHRTHRAAVDTFLLKGPGLVLGALAYPAAMWCYRGLERYVFVDLATGICFLLIVVGAAGLITRVPPISRVIGLCGTYSYGIYLLHQPHINSLSVMTKHMAPVLFGACAIAAVVVMALEGIWVEKTVNRWTSQLLDGKRS